jgi:hypothetical protein
MSNMVPMISQMLSLGYYTKPRCASKKFGHQCQNNPIKAKETLGRNGMPL